jgi:cytochrome c556
MKTTRIMAFIAAAIFIAVTQSYAQPQIPLGTKEFMREKLEHAQKVLEAIALEDFDTLAARAQKLSAMTQGAKWQAFQNPDYVEFSMAFRRNVDAMAKAARDKNIDGATLAYVRMTMSCVECHKFVRGKLFASADGGNRPTGSRRLNAGIAAYGRTISTEQLARAITAEAQLPRKTG